MNPGLDLDLSRLRAEHKQWLSHSDTSKGQLEDSKTITSLIDRIEELDSEIEEARDLIWDMFGPTSKYPIFEGKNSKIGPAIRVIVDYMDDGSMKV